MRNHRLLVLFLFYFKISFCHLQAKQNKVLNAKQINTYGQNDNIGFFLTNTKIPIELERAFITNHAKKQVHLENNYTAYSKSFFTTVVSTDFRYFTINSCVFDNCYNYYGTGGAVSCKSDFGITKILHSNFNSCFSDVSSGAIFSISKNLSCEENCYQNCTSSQNCGCAFFQFKYGCVQTFGMFSCDNIEKFSTGSFLWISGSNIMEKARDANITNCNFAATSAINIIYSNIAQIYRSIFFNNTCYQSLIKSDTTTSTIRVTNIYLGYNTLNTFFNFRTEVAASQIMEVKWMSNIFVEMFGDCDYEGMVFEKCIFDFPKIEIDVQYIGCFFNTSYRATPIIYFQPNHVCNMKAKKTDGPGFFTTPVGIVAVSISTCLFLVIVVLVSIIIYRKKQPEVRESDIFYTDEYFSHLISRNPLIIEDEG